MKERLGFGLEGEQNSCDGELNGGRMGVEFAFERSG